MTLHLAPVRADKPHHLFARFSAILSVIRAPTAVVQAGFAYATLGGVQEFISYAEPAASWQGVRKNFLIGVHQAITEPSALEALRALPNAEVRIFVPGGRIRLEALYATPVFHPKVLAITNRIEGKVKFLQVGSANLTVAAIGSRPQNYEFAVAIDDDRSSGIHSEDFNGWWAPLWRESRPVDREVIRKYAELRRQILEQNPILQRLAETPSSISHARYFFAEVGAGSGPPGFRHQVEFPEALVRFFGDPERRRRDITLERGGKRWTGRPLSYKVTTYGVDIWRLGMPTQSTGGNPIADRAIRFMRTPDPRVFEFEVVDVTESEFQEWVKLANLRGHLGATGGQRARQYGFY